jgi:multidrug efflux pump subunit AcrB
MFVNVSGDYDGIKLKEYADKMQDKFEELSEISRAEIVGAPEREIQVNVDPYKMQAARISFRDIENAIAYENNDITGGLIEVGDMKRTLKVRGQFQRTRPAEYRCEIKCTRCNCLPQGYCTTERYHQG